MLLKNFGALLANALADDTLTEGVLKCTTGEFPAAVDLRKMPNTTSSLSNVVSSITYGNNEGGSSAATWAFGFGDGTTPPTIDDYKFSGELVTLSIMQSTGIASNGSNGATFQMVVINRTGGAVTINEIGLFSQVVNLGAVMLTRDVLPEPVVLDPGDSKGFEIYIDTQSFISNAAQA